MSGASNNQVRSYPSRQEEVESLEEWLASKRRREAWRTVWECYLLPILAIALIVGVMSLGSALLGPS